LRRKVESRRIRAMTSRQIFPLLSVAVVYAAVHATLISGKLCPSRDGTRYLKYALRLETEPWKEVFRTSVDHPGYPVFLSLVFSAARTLGLSSPAEEILLSEGCTALVGLIFVVVAFAVLKRLWGLIPAWGGMLSFVLLPRPAWVFSDVLSDSLHALFWMSSAAMVLRGIELGSPSRLFAAGILAALAYWVRVDALTLLSSVAIASLSIFLTKPGDGVWPRRKAALALFLFTLSSSAGVGAFVAVIGKLSTKPVSEIFVLGPEPCLSAGQLVLAVTTPPGTASILASIWHLMSRAAQEVQGVPLVLAGMTAVAALRASPLRPRGVFLLSAHVTYLVVLVLVDLRAGYLSGRYFLPLVPFWTGFGMYGLVNIPRRLQRGSIPGWVSLGLALSLAASLPSLLKGRDHASFQEVLQAGQWIKEQMAAQDTLYDPYFYPSFLAGLRGRVVADPLPPPGGHDHYVIIEERDIPRKEEVGKLVAAKRLEKVREFGRTMEDARREVHVYRGRSEPAMKP